MTKEEHLQLQCNLLYNYILKLVEVLAVTGSQQMRDVTFYISKDAEACFKNLDEEFKQGKLFMGDKNNDTNI